MLVISLWVNNLGEKEAEWRGVTMNFMYQKIRSPGVVLPATVARCTVGPWPVGQAPHQQELNQQELNQKNNNNQGVVVVFWA